MQDYLDTGKPTLGKSLASDSSQALLKDVQTDESLGSKLGREADLLANGLVVGALNYGVDHVQEHGLTFASEVLGTAGLVLAIRGSSWMREPAAILGAWGSLSFANHVKEGLSQALPALQEAWHTGANMEQNRLSVQQSLGPLAFDMAVMGVAGAGANRLAVGLDGMSFAEVRQLAGQKFDALGERIIGRGPFDGFGDGFGPQLALADASAVGGGSAPLRVAWRGTDELNQPLMMAASGAGDGAGADPMRYRSWQTGNNETVHDFLNVRQGGDGNQFPHADDTTTLFGYNGKIQVRFPSGRERVVDLGKPIKSVNIVENPNGQKTFKFNGSQRAELMLNPEHNLLMVRFDDGAQVSMFDVPDNGMLFTHNDGLKTSIGADGKLSFKLPNNEAHSVDLGDSVGSVNLTEHVDGRKGFRFFTRDGAAHAQKIDLPAVPAARVNARSNPPPPPPPPPPRAERPISQAGALGKAGGNFDSESTFRTPEAGDDRFFGWRMGIPHTVHRGIFDVVTGTDSRSMPDSDMRSLSDLGLGLQKHNQVLEDYFERLGKGGGSDDEPW